LPGSGESVVGSAASSGTHGLHNRHGKIWEKAHIIYDFIVLYSCDYYTLYFNTLTTGIYQTVGVPPPGIYWKEVVLGCEYGSFVLIVLL
jgi:hypothetical protein